MYTYSHAPTTFYRVEDEYSRARLEEGAGIVARKQTRLTWSHDATVRLVKKHLAWGSRKPSPFISAFDDLGRAQYEADRRKEKGRRKVFIWVIKTTKGRGRNRQDWPRAEYRNLTGYAKSRKFKIPKVALNMSECEWLFLNEIPECMIVRAL
jgi:hypothetical protein